MKPYANCLYRSTNINRGMIVLELQSLPQWITVPAHHARLSGRFIHQTRSVAVASWLKDKLTNILRERHKLTTISESSRLLACTPTDESRWAQRWESAITPLNLSDEANLAYNGHPIYVHMHPRMIIHHLFWIRAVWLPKQFQTRFRKSSVWFPMQFLMRFRIIAVSPVREFPTIYWMTDMATELVLNEFQFEHWEYSIGCWMLSRETVGIMTNRWSPSSHSHRGHRKITSHRDQTRGWPSTLPHNASDYDAYWMAYQMIKKL